MEKLVAWQEVDPADREQVESPFFAKIRVDEALRHDRPLRGQQYSTTRRTITQQWVPLLEKESRMHLHAARRVYGQTRRIKQRYVEADDHWPQEGKSWHWRPVVADTVYEYRGGGFWP